MTRFHLNRRIDARIFRTTANKTHAVNMYSPRLFRGGFRL